MTEIYPDSARSTEGAIAKAPTFTPGLDEVLVGGLPRGRASLIGGGPGTGKTVLALESLYRAALAGEPGILVTFEEEGDAIRRNAAAIGWDLDSLERDRRLLIIHPDMPVRVVQSGEYDIAGLLAILGRHVDEIGARRIVIDAVDILLRVFRDPFDQQNALFMLHDWLLERALTAILTIKTADGASTGYRDIEYMVDCVLRLDQRVLGQVATRRLRVLKYRGSSFMRNEYPYIITSQGLVLMPISAAELAQQVVGPKFPFGISELDSLLDGGFHRGASVLVAGATGTGKTVMASTMTVAAAERQERTLYVSFEESAQSLIGSVRSAGIELQPAIESGCLRILTAMPEAIGVEEHLWRVYQAIDELDAQHVVVDAISACRRMGTPQAALDFIVRLLSRCKQDGITCLYLNQVQIEDSVHKISGIGVSSLIDALVLLEQDWPNDEHRRRLLIVKSRGSKHSHAYHHFQITDDGIQISAPTSETRHE